MNKKYWLGLYFVFASVISVVAYVEGLLSSLITMLLGYSSMSAILATAMLTSAVIPPLVEETAKLFIYKRTKVFEGLLFALTFIAYEFILWGTSGWGYYLSTFGIGEIVRFLFPFHLFGYFVMRMTKLSTLGWGLMVLMHGINNAACVMISFGSVELGNIIYCANFAILGILSYTYLTQTKEGKTLIKGVLMK